MVFKIPKLGTNHSKPRRVHSTLVIIYFQPIDAKLVLHFIKIKKPTSHALLPLPESEKKMSFKNNIGRRHIHSCQTPT